MRQSEHRISKCNDSQRVHSVPVGPLRYGLSVCGCFSEAPSGRAEHFARRLAVPRVASINVQGSPDKRCKYPAFGSKFTVWSLSELSRRGLKIENYFARLSWPGADNAEIPCKIPCLQGNSAEQGAICTAIPARQSGIGESLSDGPQAPAYCGLSPLTSPHSQTEHFHRGNAWRSPRATRECPFSGDLVRRPKNKATA